MVFFRLKFHFTQIRIGDIVSLSLTCGRCKYAGSSWEIDLFGKRKKPRSWIINSNRDTDETAAAAAAVSATYSLPVERLYLFFSWKKGDVCICLLTRPTPDGRLSLSLKMCGPLFRLYLLWCNIHFFIYRTVAHTLMFSFFLALFCRYSSSLKKKHTHTERKKYITEKLLRIASDWDDDDDGGGHLF
jgi:hypothetical protein